MSNDNVLELKKPGVSNGDGARGFWKALPQVFGATREQRCWVHTTANVLNKSPKHRRSGQMSFVQKRSARGPQENRRLIKLPHTTFDNISCLDLSDIAYAAGIA